MDVTHKVNIVVGTETSGLKQLETDAKKATAAIETLAVRGTKFNEQELQRMAKIKNQGSAVSAYGSYARRVLGIDEQTFQQTGRLIQQMEKLNNLQARQAQIKPPPPPIDVNAWKQGIAVQTAWIVNQKSLQEASVALGKSYLTVINQVRQFTDAEGKVKMKMLEAAAAAELLALKNSGQAKTFEQLAKAVGLSTDQLSDLITEANRAKREIDQLQQATMDVAGTRGFSAWENAMAAKRRETMIQGPMAGAAAAGKGYGPLALRPEVGPLVLYNAEFAKFQLAQFNSKKLQAELVSSNDKLEDSLNRLAATLGMTRAEFDKMATAGRKANAERLAAVEKSMGTSMTDTLRYQYAVENQIATIEGTRRDIIMANLRGEKELANQLRAELAIRQSILRDIQASATVVGSTTGNKQKAISKDILDGINAEEEAHLQLIETLRKEAEAKRVLAGLAPAPGGVGGGIAGLGYGPRAAGPGPGAMYGPAPPPVPPYLVAHGMVPRGAGVGVAPHGMGFLPGGPVIGGAVKLPPAVPKSTTDSWRALASGMRALMSTMGMGQGLMVGQLGQLAKGFMGVAVAIGAVIALKYIIDFYEKMILLEIKAAEESRDLAESLAEQVQGWLHASRVAKSYSDVLAITSAMAEKNLEAQKKARDELGKARVGPGWIKSLTEDVITWGVRLSAVGVIMSTVFGKRFNFSYWSKGLNDSADNARKYAEQLKLSEKNLAAFAEEQASAMAIAGSTWTSPTDAIGIYNARIEELNNRMFKNQAVIDRLNARIAGYATAIQMSTERTGAHSKETQKLEDAQAALNVTVAAAVKKQEDYKAALEATNQATADAMQRDVAFDDAMDSITQQIEGYNAEGNRQKKLEAERAALIDRTTKSLQDQFPWLQNIKEIATGVADAWEAAQIRMRDMSDAKALRDFKVEMEDIQMFSAKGAELNVRSWDAAEASLRKMIDPMAHVAELAQHLAPRDAALLEWEAYDMTVERVLDKNEKRMQANQATIGEIWNTGLQRMMDNWGSWQTQMEKGIQDIGNALANDIAGGLSDILDGTKSVKEGFRDMALAVVKDIQRIIIQMLVQLAIQQLIKMVGGGIGGGAAAATLNAGGAVVNTNAAGTTVTGPIEGQTGGRIGGQGSGDIVPSMLEPGEFVVRRDAAQKIGYDRLNQMNKMQAGGVVRMGTGGGVGPSFSQIPQGQHDIANHLFDVARSRGFSPTAAEYLVNRAYIESSFDVGSGPDYGVMQVDHRNARASGKTVDSQFNWFLTHMPGGMKNKLNNSTSVIDAFRQTHDYKGWETGTGKKWERRFGGGGPRQAGGGGGRRRGLEPGWINDTFDLPTDGGGDRRISNLGGGGDWIGPRYDYSGNINYPGGYDLYRGTYDDLSTGGSGLANMERVNVGALGNTVLMDNGGTTYELAGFDNAPGKYVVTNGPNDGSYVDTLPAGTRISPSAGTRFVGDMGRGPGGAVYGPTGQRTRGKEYFSEDFGRSTAQGVNMVTGQSPGDYRMGMSERYNPYTGRMEFGGGRSPGSYGTGGGAYGHTVQNFYTAIGFDSLSRGGGPANLSALGGRGPVGPMTAPGFGLVKGQYLPRGLVAGAGVPITSGAAWSAARPGGGISGGGSQFGGRSGHQPMRQQYHEGGIVDTWSAYQSGGVVAAGEGVFTKKQMASLAPSGGVHVENSQVGVNVVVNNNQAQTSVSGSGGGMSEDDAREMGRIITAVVQSQIEKQKRSGGSLYVPRSARGG